MSVRTYDLSDRKFLAAQLPLQYEEAGFSLAFVEACRNITQNVFLHCFYNKAKILIQTKPVTETSTINTVSQNLVKKTAC